MQKRMLLLELLFAFIGISQFANSGPSKLPFQQLLNTCNKLEYSNSTQCQYFLTTYPWQRGDIQLIFENLSFCNRIVRNILEERLIRLIGNPNFDLVSLGKYSFYNAAVFYGSESLAIAIWSHLKKYTNHNWEFYFSNARPDFHYTNLQQIECRVSLNIVISGNMLQLLTNMVSDQPDCLSLGDAFIPLHTGSSWALSKFLLDHGVEILPRHLEDEELSHEGLEWALVNYQHSNDLINNSIRNGSEVLGIAILEFLKQKNYNDLIFQICNNTFVNVVNTNKIELVKSMLRYCPDCMGLNGNMLMDNAINGENSSLAMIQILNFYGVEIPASHLRKAQSLGYTGNIGPAMLDYLPVRLKTPDNIIMEYFLMAVKENLHDIFRKIRALKSN